MRSNPAIIIFVGDSERRKAAAEKWRIVSDANRHGWDGPRMGTTGVGDSKEIVLLMIFMIANFFLSLANSSVSMFRQHSFFLRHRVDPLLSFFLYETARVKLFDFWIFLLLFFPFSYKKILPYYLWMHTEKSTARLLFLVISFLLLYLRSSSDLVNIWWRHFPCFWVCLLFCSPQLCSAGGNNVPDGDDGDIYLSFYTSA